MMRSPCCGAKVAHPLSKWRFCTACGKPCEPVDYERAGNSCGKTRTIHAMLFPHMPPLEHVGKKVGDL